MTDREKLKAAIDTVARHFVRNAVFSEIEDGRGGIRCRCGDAS
ncbi:hypothetical protein [Amycolatopsis taiwanensis]|nr:hypothetical protein [Amycolatopsis taiwanensis]